MEDTTKTVRQSTNQTAIPTATEKKASKQFLYCQPDNAVICDLRLPKTAFHMYTILVKMADKNTHEVTAYVDTLAKQIGRSIKTARRVLGTLASLGIIRRKFRKSHHNPKMNLATTYVIIGRFAECYAGTKYGETLGTEYFSPAGECVNNDDHNAEDPKMSVGTDKNGYTKDTRNSISILESNSKEGSQLPEKRENCENPDKSQDVGKPTATKALEPPKSQTPFNQGVKYDLSDIPDIMRDVAEFLLLKTGRTHLTPKECRIIREILDKQHTPARVLKEIRKQYDLFIQRGKNLRMLTFCYIGKILATQVSLTPKRKSHTGNAQVSQSTPKTDMIQQSEPEIAEQIMPIDEAERIISEYEPAIKTQQGIPAALEELYGKMQAKGLELFEKYEASLPKDEYGLTVWPDNDYMPEITLEDYLRLRYPEADEEELRTDTVQDKRGLIEAFETDKTCANCLNPETCPLNRKQGKPVVSLEADMRGRKRLQVRYTPCIRCKHDKSKPDPEFERRVKRSGLSEKQSKQTFRSYAHEGMPEEIVSAKAKAILAAKNHSSLILAGKAGTGKTHLATAIAIDVMRGGKQAIFRSVPELLDEMREAARLRVDFFNTRQKFQEVPCLVLDDWGKEKTTQAGMDYLYQIIDYRYKHGLQTIVTTNAVNMSGLMNEWNADKIEPLVSRILENGEWVTIRNAVNHRLTKHPEPEPEPEPEHITENDVVEKSIIVNEPNEPIYEPEIETATEEPSNEPEFVQMDERDESERSVGELLGVATKAPEVEKVPEREKCRTFEEIVSYRVKYGEMPPEYDELGDYDNLLVNMMLWKQVYGEMPMPQPEPETTPKQAEEAKKAERNPLYDDDDFWKEDEDEYSLPNDYMYRKRED